MTWDERQGIARRAIRYLRKHGLTIHEGWTINGEPPDDVSEYLDSMIAMCFPSDEDEVEEQVIGLIVGRFEKASKVQVVDDGGLVAKLRQRAARMQQYLNDTADMTGSLEAIYRRVIDVLNEAAIKIEAACFG